MKKYKLDELVREYMITSLGKAQVDSSYPRLLQTAITGLRNLNRDNRGLIKVQRIAVNQVNFTSNLPNDYLVYRKIFICYQGQQVALALNPNMCPPSYTSCGNMQVEGAANSSGDFGGAFYPFAGSFTDSSGQFTGGMYGIGGGNNGIGYYRIFEDEGYMAIQNFTSGVDEILMEYLADIKQINGATYVHPNDEEAVKAWIYWQTIDRLSNVSLGEKATARKRYAFEKKEARKRHNSFNIQDLMIAYRSGYRSSPAI